MFFQSQVKNIISFRVIEKKVRLLDMPYKYNTNVILMSIFFTYPVFNKKCFIKNILLLFFLF
jgi:hypothetical protein